MVILEWSEQWSKFTVIASHCGVVKTGPAIWNLFHL